MKKISILLSITALLILGCDNNKKELIAEYDTFLKRSDSIHTAHKNFEDNHKKMLDEHEKFSEKLESMEIQDSTIFEDLNKFGLMLERHDAILKSHTEIIEAHKNDRPNFDELSEIEMNDKIEEMKQWHQRMMDDHDAMEEEHKNMQNEFRAIEEKIMMTEGDAEN